MNFQWQWDLLRRSWDACAVDITAVYSAYLDSLNHRYRNVVEGLAEVSAADRRRVIEAYDRGYVVADGFLGRLLEACGESTTVVVASDHGSVGYRKIFRLHDALERAVNLYDVAPTVTYALGYPQPAQADGAVVFQALT